MSGRIAIAGCIAQKPQQAGHTWQYLQYLLGFRRLGWDVLFIDRLAGPVEAGDPRVLYVSDVFRDAGLDGAWTIGLDDGSHIGVGRGETLDHVRSADLLLNVMGYCDDEELLAAARHRVFLDTDPGFGQMWRALGQADIFAGHDAHVTIGERIGQPDCSIPDCGLDWITTPQPVVLDAWPLTPLPAGRVRFTSIASWRGAYGPVEYRGHRYGLRVHQMRRFADLPTLAPAAFELALHIHEDERDDIGLLRDRGWLLTDPSTAAATPSSYRQYLQGSSAELMVAKGMYVDSRSGWFSERSICYLACGRPVLAQDTGLAQLYPAGTGLITFSTLDEAVAGVESIVGDYDRHSLAARAIAEEYFDSDKVLTRLVERVLAVAA
jgi:hypothetical protein